MTQTIFIAEPSWRGHTLIFALNVAKIISKMGPKVILAVPEITEESKTNIELCLNSSGNEIDVRTCLTHFPSGYGRIFSKNTEVVTDSILEEYEKENAFRMILPTGDAMVSMKSGTRQASRLRRCHPRSIVHQPRLGYGGFGLRFGVGRELIRSRMRKCGHRMMTMDPLTHRSALRSKIDMGYIYMPVTQVEEMKKSEARDLLAIPNDARVIGVLGEHSKRKGTLELIQAWPERKDHEVILLLMGKLSDSIRTELERRKEEVTDGRIVVYDGVIDNKKFRAGFVASDVITTLYPRHHGISGITSEAARCERPVLGCTHGANGIIIEENGLGETVDARDQAALRAGLARVMKQDPVVDLERRKRFITNHSTESISESFRPWLGLENNV
jgi:glycosyltransferase involved in cell wall biosynthesis